MAFKADLKARMQCHLLDNYYKCRQCCDRCGAIQQFTAVPHAMSYKNMAKNSPYAATCKGHDEYVRTARRLSPWTAVQGFQYETLAFDMMHIVFLGTAKNHVPFCLKLLRHMGYHYSAGETDAEFLKKVSFEMKQDCKTHKPLGAVYGTHRSELWKAFSIFSSRPSCFYFLQFRMSMIYTNMCGYHIFAKHFLWTLSDKHCHPGKVLPFGEEVSTTTCPYAGQHCVG